MPTDENGNELAPTAQNANASDLDVTTLTPEQLAENPHFKDIQTKYAASRTGMDTANLSSKQLKAEVARLKILAGETEEEEPIEESTTVTKQELKDQLWELSNSKDVELYADDKYEEDIEKGIPKEYALENAKLRLQANPDKARIERNKLSAQGGNSSERNLDSTDITDKDRVAMKTWGYTEEAILKQKQLKKDRGQI